AFTLSLPTRRHLSIPWFTLMGEIGKDSGQAFPINRSNFTFRAQASGPLYIYVNDGINVPGLSIPNARGNASRSVDAAYANNLGKAVIEIEPVGR
ncbi:MAG: hypothetical protein ACR2P3_12055, partial [Geminicoccaceae bacterium]